MGTRHLMNCKIRIYLPLFAFSRHVFRFILYFVRAEVAGLLGSAALGFQTEKDGGAVAMGRADGRKGAALRFLG